MPNAYTWTMFGLRIDASALASRRKRAVTTLSTLHVGSMTLSATGRPSHTSRARYTSPMPPRPSSRFTQ